MRNDRAIPPFWYEFGTEIEYIDLLEGVYMAGVVALLVLDFEDSANGVLRAAHTDTGDTVCLS
jgi:hypothetical protein